MNASRGAQCRAGIALLLSIAVSACVTLTVAPRGVSSSGDGTLKVAEIGCDTMRPLDAAASPALDPGAIRVLTWNLHKQEDAGWAPDLTRFTRDADIALLQEAVLRDDLRAVLDARPFRFTMASAFLYGGSDHGVVTASRVAPLAVCSVRADEPLFRIPKAALVTWFALDGRDVTLAVVNLHAVNFALLLAPYEAQLAALVDVLAQHRGPIVFAGDFNTWSDARRAALRAVAQALGLTEVPLDPDRRATFFGQQLDHVMVRGLDVLAADAIAVTSSDHNPVTVSLRVRPTH